MDRKKIAKPAIVLMTIIIFGFMINVFYLHLQIDYKQRMIDQACLSILSQVHFAYDYESMQESEIRAVQAVEINSLRNAQLLIYHTSWPNKNKINNMVVSLTSYYNNIFVDEKKIDEVNAQKIYKDYIGVIVNIDSENCEPEINSILEFLGDEKRMAYEN